MARWSASTHSRARTRRDPIETTTPITRCLASRNAAAICSRSRPSRARKNRAASAEEDKVERLYGCSLRGRAGLLERSGFGECIERSPIELPRRAPSRAGESPPAASLGASLLGAVTRIRWGATSHTSVLVRHAIVQRASRSRRRSSAGLSIRRIRTARLPSR
jgi:hypothetical protein